MNITTKCYEALRSKARIMQKVPTKPVLLFLLNMTIATRSLETPSESALFISNIDDSCLTCLCAAATGCNLTFGCQSGYCGPFKIGRIYWVDAGKVILPEDEVERVGAYEDCALNYNCAQKIVKNYLAKYGKDCNGDGQVNCNDYSMINFNGGVICDSPLDRNEFGRMWAERYNACHNRSAA